MSSCGQGLASGIPRSFVVAAVSDMFSLRKVTLLFGTTVASSPVLVDTSTEPTGIPHLLEVEIRATAWGLAVLRGINQLEGIAQPLLVTE